MSGPDSTPSPRPNKPSKPYPKYPLTAHPAGYWCKKIKGRLFYFGRWDDPDAALAKYNAQRADLEAGRTPRASPDDTTAVTCKDVANAFLNHKQQAVEAGELSPHTFTGYRIAAKFLLDCVGKHRAVADLRPQDFASVRSEMSKRWGPHRVGLTVICVRAVFRHAYESELIDRPVRFGPSFKGPSKKTMRLHRAARGPNLLSAGDLRRMIGDATPTLRAVILLGVNCGLGNSDIARLPLAALDLENGFLDFARPKTGMPRRCPLWPETVAALRQLLADRRDPAGSGLVFLTRRGRGAGSPYDGKTVLKRFAWLAGKLGVTLRKGQGFYCLRHVFRTIADGAKDQPAADYVMGHEVAHMSSVYRETISDDRLKAVADHVRRWLFPSVE
jgi:integrase